MLYAVRLDQFVDSPLKRVNDRSEEPRIPAIDQLGRQRVMSPITSVPRDYECSGKFIVEMHTYAAAKGKTLQVWCVRPAAVLLHVISLNTALGSTGKDSNRTFQAKRLGVQPLPQLRSLRM
eukprot:SAG11_NODE_4711_length_1796_cov_1.532705_3_plen_121_part_00